MMRQIDQVGGRQKAACVCGEEPRQQRQVVTARKTSFNVEAEKFAIIYVLVSEYRISELERPDRRSQFQTIVSPRTCRTPDIQQRKQQE